MKTYNSQKKYINAVARKLNLPAKLKKRVLSDFATSLNARLEQGEALGDVLASLGSPAEAAAELNAEMQEYTYRKSPWRFAFLAVAVISGVWCLKRLINPILFALTIPAESGSMGIIGGADGPTSIIITSTQFPSFLIYVLPALLICLGAVAGFILLSRLKQHKS